MRSATAIVVSLPLVLLCCKRSDGSQDSSATSSGSPAATAPTALPDACSLLTPADVEAALGAGASTRSDVNQRTGKHECHLKPRSAGDIDEVIVAVDRVYEWDAMKKAQLPPTGAGQAVPGLGDDAFEGPTIGYFVRKGTLYVQVFGSVLNKAAANEKATRYLAERAAARL